jgi:hypothetical protein
MNVKNDRGFAFKDMAQNQVIGGGSSALGFGGSSAVGAHANTGPVLQTTKRLEPQVPPANIYSGLRQSDNNNVPTLPRSQIKRANGDSSASPFSVIQQ